MEQLLNTKLYIPPHRSGLVSRPHLYDRLNEGLNQKLTLVSAPAGFGKSTLVTSWLEERGHKAAWLSLDQGDNDPARFWTYMIAAIQTILPGVGDEARQVASAPQLQTTEPVVVSLINDLTQISHDLIVVLDDFHIIEEKQVLESLGYLLDHQPLHLHLVLITRADPPLSLGRLRAHRRMVDIRAGDLQFSSDEATILFNEVRNLNFNSEQVKAINQRVEGWIVGLNLAALFLKGKPGTEEMIERFTGSNKFILDYLTEEVVEALPWEVRQFLLKTSILDRFCAKLCAVITDNPASQEILEEVQEDSLFLIPLDSNGNWFRFHHLFAEVLRALLERDHPSEISALHQKAAKWFEMEGFPIEAVDHALDSGDKELARELILKHWIPILHRGEVATVLRWLDSLPEEQLSDDPFIPLARCWALFLSGQIPAIAPFLEQSDQAYKRLLHKGILNTIEKGLFASQLQMIRSVLALNQGEHSKSVRHAEEATRLVPQEMTAEIGTTWNILATARAAAGDFAGAISAFQHGLERAYAEGNLVVVYGGIFGQAMYMMIQGQLNEAEELCLKGIDRAQRDGHQDFPATGWLQIALARINMERYRLDEVQTYLSSGMRITQPGGFNEAERHGRYLRAYLAAGRGDLEAAIEIIQDTARIVNAMHDPYQIGEVNREWTKLYLHTGDLDAAGEKLNVLENMYHVTKHAHLLLSLMWMFPRLLCARERFQEALNELNKSILQARAHHYNGELVRLLALQGIALNGVGDQKSAQTTLYEAITLGAPGAYIWRWLDAGPGLVPLLQNLRNDGNMPQEYSPYLEAVLEACQDEFGGVAQTQPVGLVDPLTPRELEIIGLICQGYSNPEIASELVVTINTVKKHTSNIYGKMGVRSRTQAIARAHELNLL